MSGPFSPVLLAAVRKALQAGEQVILFQNRRVGTSETEHVTLGVQPVAQVCALNQEFLTVGLDEVVAVDGDEPIGIVLLAHVAGHQQEREEINYSFLHFRMLIFLFWMYIPFLLGCCTFRPCRS